MARRTYIDEIEDPVTGDRYRFEAQTEAELDALTERRLEALDSTDPFAQEVRPASIESLSGGTGKSGDRGPAGERRASR